LGGVFEPYTVEKVRVIPGELSLTVSIDDIGKVF
jgi:hypothetical protein